VPLVGEPFFACVSSFHRGSAAQLASPCRVEAAKEKLRDGRLSLFDVAVACGFADQSHLTRVFTRVVGISPGVWRRARDE
jgi:transcriptional regulator GlxA family with amidase domain